MVNVDEWFPNFNFFVLQILPTLLIVTFVVIMIIFWENKKIKNFNKPTDWLDILIWLSALYLIVPVSRIFDYLIGDLDQTSLIKGLFITDFRNYMGILLLVGIFGAFVILYEKVKMYRAVIRQ